MKVVAFNGSPRREGNTVALINKVFSVLESEGVDCELVHLTGKPVRGCTACLKCLENQNKQCVFDDDVINECIKKMDEADGIIIGSPTYFANVSTETKALIDRAGYVSMTNGRILERKIGAAVTAVRRAGGINVFNAINAFYFINGMIVPGSTYWNLGVGREPGAVEQDKEGMKTMEKLGENMAWLLKKTMQ